MPSADHARAPDPHAASRRAAATSATCDVDIPRHVHDALAAALRGLRFGSVEVTVHDGAVVQIERRERIRPAGVSAVA